MVTVWVPTAGWGGFPLRTPVELSETPLGRNPAWTLKAGVGTPVAVTWKLLFCPVTNVALAGLVKTGATAPERNVWFVGSFAEARMSREPSLSKCPSETNEVLLFTGN